MKTIKTIISAAGLLWSAMAGAQAGVRPQIDGDRQLALVQPLPVKALAVRASRHPAIVRPAADHVEANDLRTHLRQV